MDNKHPLKEYFKDFFLQPLPTIRIVMRPRKRPTRDVETCRLVRSVPVVPRCPSRIIVMYSCQSHVRHRRDGFLRFAMLHCTETVTSAAVQGRRYPTKVFQKTACHEYKKVN